MKLAVLFASILFSSFAMASEYKCTYKICSWSDGCDLHDSYLLIAEGNIYYWPSFATKKDGLDPSQVNNIDPKSLSSGPITKTLANGNSLATGEGLVEQDTLIRNVMYREVEIYFSLMNGGKFGRFIEITHLHHASNPNREIKPIKKEHRCTLLK